MARSAQQEHDEEQPGPGNVPFQGLSELMDEKPVASASEASSESYDPIANAMRRHPGLTRERAEELARLYGF